MGWTYYCSTDQPEGPDNGCHWCDREECHKVSGFDDFWLCDSCEIELYDTSDGGGYPL